MSRNIKIPSSSVSQHSFLEDYQSKNLNRVEELVPKAKLSKLIHLLAPQERVELEVVAAMSEIGEELVLNVIEEACQLASLKEERKLEPRDILFILGNLSICSVHVKNLFLLI